MFSKEDILQIEQKGMTVAQIEAQLECFRKGFEFLKLKGAAAVGDGIMAPTEDEAEAYIKTWNDYKAEGHRITKFVPASGAASRMFTHNPYGHSLDVGSYFSLPQSRHRVCVHEVHHISHG